MFLVNGYLSARRFTSRWVMTGLAIVSAFGLGWAAGLRFGGSEIPASAPDITVTSSIPIENDNRRGYPAEVLRVFDGDTFEARVAVWPGIHITTKVRLRGIDAPELKARCPDERTKAEAARDALAATLAQGGVEISHVGIDKFGGRVDADASTRTTSDVSAALLQAGMARNYAGGRREGWCS